MSIVPKSKQRLYIQCLSGCCTLDGIYNLLIAVQAQTQMFIPKHLCKCMCFTEQQTNWSSAPQLLCYSYCNDKGPLSKSTRIKSFIKKPFRSKFVIFFTVIDLRKKMNKKLQIHTKDCVSHNTVFWWHLKVQLFQEYFISLLRIAYFLKQSLWASYLDWSLRKKEIPLQVILNPWILGKKIKVLSLECIPAVLPF